jgi:membrane protein DedA with SNARE-associated domain
MHELVTWLVDTIGALGYPGIFALMAMESSVIPVPSELVMPPAGYLAQQGQMNMALVILCGTFGSLVGAYANYLRRTASDGRSSSDMANTYGSRNKIREGR